MQPQFFNYFKSLLNSFRDLTDSYIYGPQALDTRDDIVAWLKKYKIEHYTIDKHLTVNACSSVDLSNKNLRYIPVRFGVISGNFDISKNKITNLKNCPEIVEGSFDCSQNLITSLFGMPHSVGLTCQIEHNPLDPGCQNEFLPTSLGYQLEEQEPPMLEGSDKQNVLNSPSASNGQNSLGKCNLDINSTTPGSLEVETDIENMPVFQSTVDNQQRSIKKPIF